MCSATPVTGVQPTNQMPRTGSLEGVTRDGARLQVTGWADVADTLGGGQLTIVTSEPAEVVKVERVTRMDLPADRSRAGFSLTLRTPQDQVCVIAVDMVVPAATSSCAPRSLPAAQRHDQFQHLVRVLQALPVCLADLAHAVAHGLRVDEQFGGHRVAPAEVQQP